GAVIAMARMLVDAAHSIDGDFLDQQLLGDPRVVNAVVAVGDIGAARCRLGRGPVGTGVLLHGNPPVVDRDAGAPVRPVAPDVGDGIAGANPLSPCFRPSSPRPVGQLAPNAGPSRAAIRPGGASSSLAGAD